MKYLVLLVFFGFSFSAFGKKFATSYVSFDLLNNWHCFPEGTEWICANKMKTKSKEATIILTAKQKGPSDRLDQYMKYLKESRKIQGKKAAPAVTSKVFHVKKRSIQRHQWVDGFHSGSEVPGYYTRYLVTTKGSLSVLVTYSAHKNHYKKYAADFASSINSLRVLKSGFGSSYKGSGGGRGSQNTGQYMRGLIDSQGELGGEGGFGTGGGTGSFLGDLLALLFKNPSAGLGALVLLGGLGYFFLKRKKRTADKGERDDYRRHRPSRDRRRRRRERSSAQSRRRR